MTFLSDLIWRVSNPCPLQLYKALNFLITLVVLSDPALYWTAVGALHYLTITWPDIQYAVNQACQFQHHPTDVHCAAVKRILRYVTYTFSNGIVLRPEKPFTLTAYSDAD